MEKIEAYTINLGGREGEFPTPRILQTCAYANSMVTARLLLAPALSAPIIISPM